MAKRKKVIRREYYSEEEDLELALALSKSLEESMHPTIPQADSTSGSSIVPSDLKENDRQEILPDEPNIQQNLSNETGTTPVVSMESDIEDKQIIKKMKHQGDNEIDNQREEDTECPDLSEIVQQEDNELDDLTDPQDVFPEANNDHDAGINGRPRRRRLVSRHSESDSFSETGEEEFRSSDSEFDSDTIGSKSNKRRPKVQAKKKLQAKRKAKAKSSATEKSRNSLEDMEFLWQRLSIKSENSEQLVITKQRLHSLLKFGNIPASEDEVLRMLQMNAHSLSQVESMIDYNRFKKIFQATNERIP